VHMTEVYSTGVDLKDPALERFPDIKKENIILYAFFFFLRIMLILSSLECYVDMQ
jgi:hypothetical protein